jgi:hypothetical protein
MLSVLFAGINQIKLGLDTWFYTEKISDNRLFRVDPLGFGPIWGRNICKIFQSQVNAGKQASKRPHVQSESDRD